VRVPSSAHSLIIVIIATALEEVFLRLCKEHEGSNQAVMTFEEIDEPGGLLRCRSCNSAERQTASVNVHTEWKQTFEFDDLLCLKCAMGTAAFAERVAADKEAAAVAEKGSIADGAGSDLQMELAELASATSSSSSEANEAKQSIVVDANDDGDSSTVPASQRDGEAYSKNAGGLIDPGEVSASVLRSSQIRAVFNKNFQLFSRAPKASVLKLMLMILAICLIALLPTNPGGDRLPPVLCPEKYLPYGATVFENGNLYYSFQVSPDEPRKDRSNLNPNKPSELSEIKILMKEYCAPDHQAKLLAEMGEPSANSAIQRLYNVDNGGSLKPVTWLNNNPQRIWYKDVTQPGSVGFHNLTTLFTDRLDSGGFSSGGVIDQNQRAASLPMLLANQSDTYAATLAQQLQQHACTNYNSYSTVGVVFNKGDSNSNNAAATAAGKDFPVVGIVSERLDFTTGAFSYEMLTRSPESQQIKFGFTANPGSKQSCQFFSSVGDPNTFSVQAIVNALHNAYLTARSPKQFSIGPAFFNIPRVPFFGKDYSNISAVQIVFLSLVPLVLMLMLPNGVERIVREREEKLELLMRLSGMRASTYWISNYLFDVSVNIVWAFVFLFISYAVGTSAFVNSSIWLFVPVLVVWAHSLQGCGVLLSVCFSKASYATIFTSLFIIVITGIGVPLSYLSDDSWSPALLMIPPLSFIRGLSLVTVRGNDLLPITADSLLVEALLYNFASGTVVLFVGLAFNVARYLSLGKAITRWLCGSAAAGSPSSKHTQPALEEKLMDDDVAIAIDSQQKFDDVDVVDERERVFKDIASLASGDDVGNRAVRIERLCKVYGGKGGKLAVDDLTIGVDAGEVLGLLGPNGAGKTTSLSAMSGLINPSSGSMKVCGFDVETELEKVYTLLGICPQFDCVWGEMTTREHLLFYARLKGATKTKERAIVQRLAEMVELDGDSLHKMASTLSGGQRRRLSLATSLIGNPRVWILDEPTTGLSPDARRIVWRIVSQQRSAGRACIVSTHSMEEADTLASRIAIMGHGRLLAIGSQAHLKKRFGSGFKLTVAGKQSFTAAQIDAIDAYVKTLSSSAQLQSAVDNSIAFTFPHTEPLQLLSVFARLDGVDGRRRKEELGILEVGVGQASLEEVFIATVGDEIED
jgi:ABC-type multidrug transport system ATPase subunit